MERSLREGGRRSVHYKQKHSRNLEELLESIELEPYAGLIQSRSGELRVGEARYEDLLGEADEAYPAYLSVLKEVLGGAGA